VHGGHDFPPRPSFGNLSSANPPRRSRIDTLQRMGRRSTCGGSAPPPKLQPSVPDSKAGNCSTGWKRLEKNVFGISRKKNKKLKKKNHEENKLRYKNVKAIKKCGSNLRINAMA